ncbi:hypothetical protein NDU88_011210 [Pleurodeles waltl]|uniref:Uncharacterized protein n=1 Tax=Pleurodeles waltl TaxID=8319 RepID=A0AAV7S383_PLEWA|nr:hypothetical protein NDU88_011210 [Pleurodeles waltl]
MGSGGGPPPVPFTEAMTGEGGVLPTRRPPLLPSPPLPGPGYRLRPPGRTRPTSSRDPTPAWPQPLLRTRRGPRGEQAAAAVFSSTPGRFTSVSRPGRMDGGSQASRPAPAGQCTGRAAHLVPSSSAAQLQGSAAGARSRPPRDSLRSFSLPRKSSAQLSAWPRPGRARRDRHLVFPPGIGPISARA